MGGCNDGVYVAKSSSREGFGSRDIESGGHDCCCSAGSDTGSAHGISIGNYGFTKTVGHSGGSNNGLSHPVVHVVVGADTSQSIDDGIWGSSCNLSNSGVCDGWLREREGVVLVVDVVHAKRCGSAC